MGGLMPKAPKPPPPPAAPAVMPTPDDGAIAAAKQKQLQSMMSRSGRASTIMSQSDGGNDKLGN